MKIVFNTNYLDAPASIFYLASLRKIKSEFVVNDWGNYTLYNVALFMTYPKDLECLKTAKIKSPDLKIGLIDPRNSTIDKYIDYIDFFIVDSLEMYDFFCRYKKPIHVYHEYPEVETKHKIHSKKDEIVIAYHGNKVHLAAMESTASQAITELAKKYKIELWLIYNIEKQKKITFGLPSGLTIKHIQWTENIYDKLLYQADIGIAPALMPIYKTSRIKRKAAVFRHFFGETDEDYLIRFKMPTNPGRMLIFANLGIPIVADFYPSAMQLISHGYNGMLAYSIGGWYNALEQLIVDSDLRQKQSDNMHKKIVKFDSQTQNENFVFFLKNSILSNYSEEANILPLYRDNSVNLRKKAAIAYYSTKWHYLKKYLRRK